ncbi:M64 family metallopeptidase [Odoribacter laneus]|uniref:M64 family metallopeptidase n=2 Tax=Odoribacter laneus TaxID=626933 RepID=UPI003994428F
MLRLTKIILLFFSAFLLFGFLGGCSEDKKEEILPPPVEPCLTIKADLYPLNAQGDSTELVFTTNESWNIVTETEEEKRDWYRVYPLSGDAGEDIRVNVQVDSNLSYSDRNFVILLKSESLEERIEVRQLKQNVILLGGNRYEVTFEEQTLTVEVRSNVDYRVEIGEGSDWIIETPESRSEELKRREHVFRIANNLQESARTGLIFFRDLSSSLSDELTLIQSGWEDPDPERTALVSIYESSGGDSWTRNDNWCSDKPLSDWYGVETDAWGHVTALRLSHNNLSGTISEKISKLTGLQHLDLSWNDLGGEISIDIKGYMYSNLDNLLELESINLSHNRLEGYLPDNWYKLEKLQYLNLSFNRIKSWLSTIWDPMFKNGRTVDLILNGNYLYGDIPKSIQDHPDWNRLALQMIRQNPGGARLNYDKDIYLPDFTFTDLSDGSEHSIREVYSANKLTMLLHWDPLQESSGDFISTIVRRFHTLFRGQGFTVVGITPEGEEYREAAKRYIREQGISWTAVTDYRDNDGRRIILPDYPYPSYQLVDGSGKLRVDMFNGQYSPPPPNLEESLSMDIFSLAHTDYLNRFCWDIFGESTYESVDYRMDKQYETLQRASKGRGIDIVLLGDAFTDIDIATGYYHNVMEFVMESFFSIEPTKTYRDYFNVHMVYAVSRRACIGDDPSQVALGTVLDKTNGISNRLTLIPDYIYTAVPRGVIPYPSIIMNNNNVGLTFLKGSGIIEPNYSFSGYSIGGRGYLKSTVLHESVGHGFGLLADEYINYLSDDWQEISDSKKNRLKLDHEKGLSLNVSLTDDPTSVYWSHLIGHSRYPYVGVYEGGYYYASGVWRSEYESVMRSSRDYLYFNAISRELLVKRILELSGEGYSFEKFLQTDSDEGRPYKGTSVQHPFGVKRDGWVHHPPVMLD